MNRPDGIGQADDPCLRQVEAADLVGRAVAVLGRPQHAQARVPVALELADDVHQVLERARPGDRAVLGHVPDEHDRHVARLGGLDHGGADLAHLGDPAGGAVHLRGRDGLHVSSTSRSGSTAARCARGRWPGRSPTASSRSARARGCGRRAAAPAPPTPRRSRTARAARCAPRGPRRRAAASTCRPRARRPGAPRPRARGRRRARGRARRPPWSAPGRSRRRSGRWAARWTASGAVATVCGAPPPGPVSSSTEPHAWHSPQRPTHLVAVQPHSVQRNAGRAAVGRGAWLVEVTGRTLDAGSDTRRRRPRTRRTPTGSLGGDPRVAPRLNNGLA